MHGTVGTIINFPKHQQCLALMMERLDRMQIINKHHNDNRCTLPMAILVFTRNEPIGAFVATNVDRGSVATMWGGSRRIMLYREQINGSRCGWSVNGTRVGIAYLVSPLIGAQPRSVCDSASVSVFGRRKGKNSCPNSTTLLRGE